MGKLEGFGSGKNMTLIYRDRYRLTLTFIATVDTIASLYTALVVHLDPDLWLVIPVDGCIGEEPTRLVSISSVMRKDCVTHPIQRLAMSYHSGVSSSTRNTPSLKIVAFEPHRNRVLVWRRRLVDAPNGRTKTRRTLSPCLKSLTLHYR